MQFSAGLVHCSVSVCFSAATQVSCQDGEQDGTETDVDCGSSCPIKCSLGQKCLQQSDCVSSLLCVAFVCTEVRCGTAPAIVAALHFVHSRTAAQRMLCILSRFFLYEAACTMQSLFKILQKSSVPQCTLEPPPPEDSTYSELKVSAGSDMPCAEACSNALSDLENMYLLWIGQYTVPYITNSNGAPLSTKEERCNRGAAVVWWALQEGILNQVGLARRSFTAVNHRLQLAFHPMSLVACIRASCRIPSAGC